MAFLKEDDVITSDTWCRPLDASWAGGWNDSFMTEGWGGQPINNFRWVQVKYVFGPVWWGLTLEVFNERHHENGLRESYEFAHDVPETSKLEVNPKWVNLEKYAKD